MMLDIHFLGTSAGIPSVDRSMPCIALKYLGEVYLFDIGECCQRQMMKYKVGYGSINSIFISHLHLDHFLGFYGLVETLRMTTDFGKGLKKLNVFAPEGFSNLLINKWDFLGIHSLNVLNGKKINFDGFYVKPFRVKHVGDSFGFVFEEFPKRKFIEEKAKSYGIKGVMFKEIETKGHILVNGNRVNLDDISYVEEGIKIVYTGDTMYDKNIAYEAKGADVLIADSTFDASLDEEADERYHMTAEKAGLLAKEASVKTLVLTHISARYKDNADILVKDAAKHFNGNIVLASDGLLLRLKKRGAPIELYHR